MPFRSTCSAILVVLLVVGISGLAFADQNDEVKKVVERTVGSAVGTAVSESVSRSITTEGPKTPTTSLFVSPFYNRTDATFATTGFTGSFTADTYGGVVGALQKLNDFSLLHGAAAFAGTHVESGGTSSNVRVFDLRLGADLVVLKTESVKSWFTLEGGVSDFGGEKIDKDVWAWSASPSATLSLRGGPILFEPSVAFLFTRPFNLDDNGEVSIAVQPGISVKYRGEKFRPQFNFSYQRVLKPDNDDPGVVSFGPEILYAVTPSFLIGGAYSYSRPLASEVTVNSHTFTLEFRWIF